MKKNKGFTLVELLVVIVILGIITAISIPLIRNIQQSMTKRKYTTYLNSLKTSGKLYSDSYNEDMFGHNKTGVYCISYSELEKKKLIKDISIDDISCNKDNTFVRVTKLDDKYAYTANLNCGSKTKKDDVSVVLPEGSTLQMNDEFCSGDITTTMVVKTDPNYDSYIGTTYNKKRKKTKLVLSSVTGIHNNISVSYSFSKTLNDTSGEFTPINFTVEGNQKKKLLEGEVISTSSDELITPKNGNGLYYLVVRVDKFNDLYGNSWKNPDNSGSKYVSFGPYAVDSEKPTITNLRVEKENTNSKYNTLETKVTFTGKDNLTKDNELKMCISDSGYCTNYKKYSSTSTFKLSGGYDGGERTVYVSLVDLAGNVKQTTIKYTVAITHKLTYDSNGGGACNPTSKSVTHDTGDNTTWGTLCTPTRTGYTFVEWKNGSTTITKDTKVTGNITVKAQWNINVCTITFDPNGGTFGNNNNNRVQKMDYGTSNSNFWNANGGTYSATRTGYHIDETKAWIKGSTTYDETKGYSATDVCTNLATKSEDVTLKVNWKINSYTLKYDDDGGSGCSSKTITKDHGQTWGTLCTPTKTGYTFGGWKSGSTTINANSTATASITVKASWTANTYTLTYNNNGGSGCGSKTGTYNSTWGSLCTPSRTGYTFGGWKNGSTAVTSSTKVTGNLTVTASWSANSYTLTINSNGGSGCSGTITKSYGQSWGLSCTPSRTGYTFGGWNISPSTATSNGTATAKWTAKNGWELSNPGSAVLNQKWIYWQNGTRIQSGWKQLPSGGAGSTYYWYYFVNGIAHDGWLNDGGVWYYLTHEDLNRNGSKDCRMLYNECRWVRPENGCWCFDSQGHSTGRHDGMCNYY